jgi:hypothetical protein
MLGEDIDLFLVRISLTVGPEFDLSHDLVSEAAGHDKTGVTSSTAKIEQSAGSKDDHSVAIREGELVNLRFDVEGDDALESLKTSHIDLVIEMTDVPDDGIVLHLGHVGSHNDILVTSGGDENISPMDNTI